MRLLIAGGPKTGKTTLANTYHECLIRHTDDLVDLNWNAQSDEIVHWLDEPGPWVIEGAAVVRALRKWLRSHPEGLPFDQLIYLTKPMIESTYWQRVMAKGAHTIWNEIEPVINQRLAGQIINLR